MAEEGVTRPGPVTSDPGPTPNNLVLLGIDDSRFRNPSDILNPPRDRIRRPRPKTLKDTAPKSPQSLTVTAEGAVINLLYGRVPVPPKVFAVGTISNDLVLGLLWGKGECNSIENVYANKDALAGSKVHNYTGTAGQTADSWLATAIAGYADTLAGICYSVVRVNQSQFTSIPRFTGIIQGRIIHDPRGGGSDGYSTNPALMFRDVALLGGLAVDDTSISDTADACDALVSGSKRREAGVVFDAPNSLDAILNTLAEYAGGFYVNDGGVAKLIPNRPASVSMSFTDAKTDAQVAATTLSVATGDNSFNDSGSGFVAAGFKAGDTIYTTGFTNGGNNGTWVINTVTAGKITVVDGTGLVTESAGASATVETQKLKLLQDTISINKISTKSLPNRVVCEYTDTSTVPWRRAFAATDVPAGEIRTTRLVMPGIQTYARARRQAIERLNHYQLTDLLVEFVAFDESLELEPGDVFDVDHADGLTVKQFRCESVQQADDIGHWRINGREYDPNEWSDEALADPTFPDTNLPDPALVSDAPVPALAESNYQLQNETYATRLDITWAAVTDYPYNHEYEVQVFNGSTLIATVRTSDLKAAVGPLQEGQTYTADLYVVGVGGIKGTKGSANLLALGKQNPPTFPGGSQLRANESGGRVFMNWDAADDDIWAYEVRYGSSGQTWAQMATLTQTDALYYIAETIPAGTWDLKVRAIDSVGVESTNELTLAGLEVTSDADSYASVDAAIDVDDPAGVTNMSKQANDWLPDDGTSWDTLFPNAMNTYTNPLVTYGGSFTTEIISQEHDVGAIISANFQLSVNVEELVGTVDYTMQISDTSGGPWTDYNQLSVNASGRYVRMKVTGLTTDRFVLRPEYFRIVALVNTINKEGQDTSNAGSAKTITLDRTYSKVVTIQITPITAGGGEDLTGVADNVVLGPGNTSFDVFIYNGGTQVARDFYYTARVVK